VRLELDFEQVVVITGASAGVGRATVREFARRGAKIGLVARGTEGLEATKREVEDLGGRALVIPTDVAHYEQVQIACEIVEKEFGPIDVWINNAMVSVFSPFKDMTADEFRRVTEVTYLGTVHGTMVALKSMMKRNKGVIIQVGSALAYRAIPLQSAYCGAKHGVEGFTESIRSELIHDRSRIHICMVQLPACNTPQFNWVKSKLRGKPQPVPPIYQPEVAARAIVWAAFHRRRELKVGFPTLIAIYGNKFFPGIGDRYLAEHGYKDQQLSAADDPNRPNNLWKPVRRDFGAHGDFDQRSKSQSLQLWANIHRTVLVVGGAVAIVFGLFLKGVSNR
jgi:short-subunit dehydrogenase